MTQTDPDPDPSDRDRAEAFIEDKAAHLTSRPVKLRPEATKILTALAKKDPAAWQQFVDDVTVEVVVSRLRSYLAAQRHASLHAERTSVFRTLHNDTVVALRSGKPVPSPFENRYSLPGSNDWVRFGSLTRPDLLALSANRSRLAHSNGIEAIYFSVVAARLPDDVTTVEEALTVDDVLSLHEKAESADLGDLPTPPTDTDTDKDQK